MRMYSEKFSKIAWFRIWTYDEVIVVENGYAEVDDDHPNSIAALKTPRKGSFVEVSEVLEVLPGSDAVEPETETIEVETPETETPETETPETETIEVEVTETVTAEEEVSKDPLTSDELPEEKGDEQGQVESPAGASALTEGDVEVLVTRSGSKRRTGTKKRRK